MDGPKISDVLVRRAQKNVLNNQISWSRQGHLAYAAPRAGKHNLLMTYLECVDGQTWQLAPPTGFQIGSFGRVLGAKKYHYDHEDEQITGADNLSKLTTVQFSNTGWDLFLSDSVGHVSICVTGIKRVLPTASGQAGAHTTATPSTNQSPTSQNQGVQAAQYSRTSFNSFELLYTDSSFAPFPDLSTALKREGNQILSIKWLNIDKPVIVNSPAVKTQATRENPVTNGCASKLGAAAQDAQDYYYTYTAHQYKPYGTMHPLATKQACIGVRKNGEVWLWYQEDHGIEYKRAVNQLPIGDVLLEHAALGFTRDGEVIVAVQIGDYLKIFEVIIDWGFLVEAAKQLTKTPTYRVPDENRIPPKLGIRKVASMGLCSVDENASFCTGIQLVSPDFSPSTELELLLLFDNDRSLGNKSPVSTIYRYQLRNLDMASVIHPMFGQIASNQSNVFESRKTYKPIFKQKFTFDEAIVCLELLNLDLTIAVTLANGEIKLINRQTFKAAQNIYNLDELGDDFGPTGPLLPETVSCLTDAGFEFPRIEFLPQYTCISPNVCCFVAMPWNETTLHIDSARTNAWQSDAVPNKKGLLLATAAAVAFRHTNACYYGYSTDDLVATIRCELEQAKNNRGEEYAYRLLMSILQESQRAINLNIDVSSEQTDKMLQNQPLQRILTLQLSLGTELNWRRNKSGMIAWALVNLKFVTSSIMYTIHTIYSNMQRFAKKGLHVSDTLANARAREESIIAVLGVIRWCVDYIVWLNQELVELHGVFKSNNPKEVEQFLAKSVAIPLVLGKVPRSFLIFAISNIRRLFSFVQKFIEKNDPSLAALVTPDNPMGTFKSVENQLFADSQWTLAAPSNNQSQSGKAIVAHPTIEAYVRLGSLINNSPIILQAFERFLLEADGPLRNMRLDPITALAIEQQLICQGHVSKTFVEPLRKLCEVYDRVVLTNGSVDLVELYFYDVSWLNLGSKEADMAGFNAEEKRPALIRQTDQKFSNSYNKKLIQMNTYDGLILDMLRRQLLKPSEFIANPSAQQANGSGSRPAVNGSNSSNTQTLMMRKCIRCGAISSVNGNEVYLSSPTFIVNPVYQHYQRICFCGGAWANM
ncbi:hypothetical protein KL919_001408 [Ogataea angusta]|nr:hypothetical protein KL939_001507 [Ogataea angusta]KAG7862278.1 hypothetical protein KL919_001408 [Ogataea angusta]